MRLATFLLILAIAAGLVFLWLLTRLGARAPSSSHLRLKTRSVAPPPVPQVADLDAASVALHEHRRMVSKQGDVAADTSAGNRSKSPFNASGQYNLPVRWRIDYVDQHGVLSKRTIQIEHLKLRPPMVEAFCESRGEYRTFFIDGIQKAVDPASGLEADVDSYVRHIRKKRAK